MKRILFLDLDGTIRRTRSGEKFINSPEDQELIPGALEAIKEYHDNFDSWIIVGITNQGGVPDYMSLADAIVGCQTTIELAEKMIDSIFMATGMEGKYCWKIDGSSNTSNGFAVSNIAQIYPQLIGAFRKPGTGMVEAACTMYGVVPSLCRFVGDREEDKNCAIASGIDFLPADRWRH